MSITSPKRRSWRQFGLGTLFVLVMVAAVLSGLARREMLREERRVAILRELQATRAVDMNWVTDPTTPTPWRVRLGAWLRGLEPVAPIRSVSLPKGKPAAWVGELVDLFPSINSISLDAGDATAEKLVPLAQLQAITDFRIHGELKADEDAVAALGRIRSEDGIIVDITSIDDEKARRLVAAKVDAKIIFSHGSFWDCSDEGLRSMAQFSKLVDIHLGPKGTDSGLEAFRGAPSVVIARLNGSGYTDASADVIASFHPYTVWLEETGHTDKGLAKVVTGPNVSSVTLKLVPVGRATLAALVATPTLRSVTLEGVELSLDQCDQLAKLKLTTLRLVGNEWDDERLARFEPLGPTLLDLSLHAPNVTDVGVAWLGKADVLNGLHLFDTKTTAKTWNALPSLSTLRNVSLGGSHVDASVLAATQRIKGGGRLFLTGPSIDDTLLAAPRGSFSLLSLDRTSGTLDGIKAQSPGASKLRLLVQHHPNEPSPVTEEDAHEISAASGGRLTVECRPSTGWLP